MPYKIKSIVSGLMKAGVIENGEVITKKLFAGDIVEVQEVNMKELESGYYKIVKDEVVKEDNAMQARVRQLDYLITGMKQMMQGAEELIAAIKKPETDVPVKQVVAEENIPSVQTAPEENDLAEFTVSEKEAREPEIYTTQKYKEGNAIYQNVLRNTVAHSMGAGITDDRRIDKIGNMGMKRMPTVSEEKVGHRVEKEKEEVEIVDASGNSKRQRPVNVITDRHGKIDVVKSLGLKVDNLRIGL